MEKPSLPKGTRDFGPTIMARRQYIVEAIQKVFKKYGFRQLETPAMENLSTLTGKYGDEGDQLLFKILNSGDFLKNVDPKKLEKRDSKTIAGEISEKGLKYDLTVPFARYVVMNRNEVTFPFKRYQIQPVWRADRPQKGRYREFYQCDADVIGTDSLLCEAEIILMIHEVCTNLQIKDYSIKVNHRGILSGLAEIANAKGNETPLFVAIDKLDKIGEERVKEELKSKGFDEESISAIFEVLNYRGNNIEKIEFAKNKLGNSATGQDGISDINEIIKLISKFDLEADSFELDMTLARGLSYYTGTIFEVKINNVAIGSVCGGGRYDDLTGDFGLPGVSGVGFSFGVDRLYDALDELKLFPEEAEESSQVFIAHMDESSMTYGLESLKELRNKGIASEIYPDIAKLKKQLDYANKKKIPFVIVIGSEEMSSGELTFKNMRTGDQQKLTLKEILIQF
ncbi:MAG TPA: histidine--tRNA ligase [Cyclobacteriaceae bacterium]